MPDGVVQWFDPKRGEGRVVRGGKEYPVEAAEIEPHARVAGARVHFDIARRNGVAVATGVRLRGGTRVSWRQRRFGDLSGARRPDTKGPAPFARPHPEAGLHLAVRPMEVARRWAALLDDGDLDGALLLYAPAVRVHLSDGTVVEGATAAARALAESPPVVEDLRLAGIHGEDDTVVVEWAREGGEAPWRTRLLVEHGEIAEQWLGVEAPASRPEEGQEAAVPVEVVTSGAFSEAEVAYAREKIGRILRYVEEPVLFARITLRRFGDRARERPVNVKAALDINGTPVRVHIAAHEVREAVDLVERRLRDKLEHRAERIEARRQGVLAAQPGGWRHGMFPTRRPEYFERPPEEREIIRRKTFAVDELTPDEAAFDMELLDYEFYLFRDLASGADAVLERLADGTYRIRRLRPVTAASPAAITVVEGPPAPTLTLEEAIARLDASGEPFVFFADAATGRGTVVYRRYDGHYGVLEPTEA